MSLPAGENAGTAVIGLECVDVDAVMSFWRWLNSSLKLSLNDLQSKIGLHGRTVMLVQILIRVMRVYAAHTWCRQLRLSWSLMVREWQSRRAQSQA